MIIDFHTHCFPDNLADRAIRSLKNLNSLENFGDGTEKTLIKTMEKANIDISVVLNIATNSAQVEKINNYIVKRNSNKLIYFGTLHPDYDNNINQINFLSENRIKGIKLHPEFQKFNPNDKNMFKIYEKIIEKDMVVLFHSGYDEFAKNEYLFSDPKKFAEIQKKLPDLKMVLAHVGGYKVLNEVKKYIFGKKIYIDLSYYFDLSNISFLKEIFDYHSENYILYGSDWPWKDLTEYKNLIENEIINDTQKKKIFYQNGKKLLKL